MNGIFILFLLVFCFSLSLSLNITESLVPTTNTDARKRPDWNMDVPVYSNKPSKTSNVENNTETEENNTETQPVNFSATIPTRMQYIEEDSRKYPPERDIIKRIDTSDQTDKTLRRYYDNYTVYLDDNSHTSYDKYLGKRILKRDDSASAYLSKNTIEPNNTTDKEEIVIKEHETLIDYFIKTFINNS